jgi:hypothetical protein
MTKAVNGSSLKIKTMLHHGIVIIFNLLYEENFEPLGLQEWIDREYHVIWEMIANGMQANVIGDVVKVLVI